MKVKTRWVIVGDLGLYVGQWLTRKDAISDHVRAYYGFHLTDKEKIKKAWQTRKEQGDRAIKATITYDS